MPAQDCSTVQGVIFLIFTKTFISSFQNIIHYHSGVPRNFFRGEGVSTNSVEDREQREVGSVCTRLQHSTMRDFFFFFYQDLHFFLSEYNTLSQWRTQDFIFGGREVQQIQLRTENRENGDLGT